MWIVGLVLAGFFYFRSGSLGAALTIGLAAFLASFRSTYIYWQQYKKEALEEEGKHLR